MTKKIRVENADNSSYKVKVEVFEPKADTNEFVLVKSVVLNYPTDMEELYLNNTNKIVITEP